MNPNVLRNGIACLAILLLPAAAWASDDLTPPALVSLAYAPGTVDVSSSSQVISITVQATDNSSGVESISCAFRSPSGNQNLYFSLTGSDLVSGSPLSGEYSGTSTLESCAEPGTWTLTSVIVTDECGNSASYASAANGSTLAFPTGTPTILNVTNSNPAVTPQVVSFTFAPTSLDLTSSNGTVTATAELSDTGMGVSSGYFYFVSPSGQAEGGSFDPSNQVSGDQYDGIYQTTVPFTNCDEPGSWTLAYLSVTDFCNVTTVYGPSGLPFPAGTPTSLTVTNPNADTTPPQLVSLALSATMADVSNFAQSIDVTAVATDDSSGVSYGSGYYSSPDGKQTINLSFDNSNPGITLDGTFSGTLNVSTCNEPGVYTLNNLSVTDECGNTAQYGGSNAAFPPGTPTSFLVANGTISTGSLVVNILPPAAEYAGQWNVDGGISEFSGHPVTGLSPGQHMVNFLNTLGYITPPSQEVMIVANQTTYTSGTYYTGAPSGSLQVTLQPPAAVSAGAQWNVDNGPLQPSGAVVNGLVDGSHTIEFTDETGFTTPASQTVTTSTSASTITTGTYTPITQTGSLTVTLLPAGAANAGAEWNVDGGPSERNGAVVSILIGEHSVNFTAAAGYAAPLSQGVLISANQTTSTTGTYTVLVGGTGSLTVNILPAAVKASAAWNLDGGINQKSGVTLAGISSGDHTVNFTTVTGYVTPASQTVEIAPDQTLVTTVTYSKPGGFSIGAVSFAGLTPDGMDLLTLSVLATGKFTGKIVTAAGTYALSGSFSSAGPFSGVTPRPASLPYTLRLTGSSPSTYMLTGSALGEQFTAYPASYAKGQKAVEAGTYTVLFTGTDPSANVPQGTGSGTLTVTPAGRGRITGKLGDGTAFTASNILVAGSGGNELIVYDPKYSC